VQGERTYVWRRESLVKGFPEDRRGSVPLPNESAAAFDQSEVEQAVIGRIIGGNESGRCFAGNRGEAVKS
jgi:hypothetical protein